jgi:hypothetical protein
MKKQLLETLRAKASQLPPLPVSIDYENYSAEELKPVIKKPPTLTPNLKGKKLKSHNFNADYYPGWRGTLVNHLTRMKAAYLKSKDKGVSEYCGWVIRERTRLNKLADSIAEGKKTEKVI